MDARRTYILVLHADQQTQMSVGSLGTSTFPAGYYMYVGSARGSGGLRARLTRHLRDSKPQHWHVDYLLSAARVVEIWEIASSEKLECTWAQALMEMPGASTPVPGFGSSDCGCPSHLIHFTTLPSLEAFRAQLRSAGLDHALHRDLPANLKHD